MRLSARSAGHKQPAWGWWTGAVIAAIFILVVGCAQSDEATSGSTTLRTMTTVPATTVLTTSTTLAVDAIRGFDLENSTIEGSCTDRVDGSGETIVLDDGVAEGALSDAGEPGWRVETRVEYGHLDGDEYEDAVLFAGCSSSGPPYTWAIGYRGGGASPEQLWVITDPPVDLTGQWGAPDNEDQWAWLLSATPAGGLVRTHWAVGIPMMGGAHSIVVELLLRPTAEESGMVLEGRAITRIDPELAFDASRSNTIVDARIMCEVIASYMTTAGPIPRELISDPEPPVRLVVAGHETTSGIRLAVFSSDGVGGTYELSREGWNPHNEPFADSLYEGELSINTEWLVGPHQSSTCAELLGP